MIEQICSYPHGVVMAVSAWGGAMLYAGYSIYVNLQSKKGFKFEDFEWSRLLDTAWQSAGAGAIAGASIGCGWQGIIIAMITGIGTDKLVNKIKFDKKQIFNLVKLISDFVEKHSDY